MTKDEYGDFVLRYKGCGACFPIYHTLSRFEKMWFTAIQKDVAELEAKVKKLQEENEKMKAILNSVVKSNTCADLVEAQIKAIDFFGGLNKN